ncbi:hypothetical protein D3C81_542960 [compost metagenome]
MLGKLGIAALALPQLLAQAALDDPEVAFQRVQVEARQRPQAFTQTFTLRLGQRRAGDARSAVVALLLQTHAFARQLRAFQTHVFVGALGLVAQAARQFDLLTDTRQCVVAFAQVGELFVDIGQALQTRAEIDFVPVALHQHARGQLLFLAAFALLAQHGDVGFAACDALRQLLPFALEHAALVAVVVAQHPALAVVDGVAVVLFVTIARVLDLAFAGQCAVFVAQLAGVVHAGVIEAAQQLVVDPIAEGVVTQLQFVDQRTLFGLACMQQLVVAHAEVHQLGAQMRAVGPFGHLAVVLFIDQQRLRETVQHALDGTAPTDLVFAHLHQFADERQHRFRQAGVVAQPRAHLLQRRRDGTGRGLQRFQFHAQCGEALFIFAALGHALGDGIVHGAGAIAAAVDQRTRLFHLLGERGRGIGQRHAQLTAGAFQLLATAGAFFDFTLDAGAFALQFLDALTALLALQAFQFNQLLFVVVQRLTTLAFLAHQATVDHVHFAHALVDQLQPRFFAVAVNADLQVTQVGHALAQLGQVVMELARRGQCLHLTARGDHGMVGTVEFGEVFDQAIGRFKRARFFEHEATQEGVEVAQVLGRLRLVQQAQRHVVADAEQMAEALGITGEAVEMRNVFAQTQAQLAQVQIEAFQFGQVETARYHHVVLAHIVGRRAGAIDPEHAHDGHRVAAGVVVFQRQCGPGGALAQVLRGDFAGLAVLLVGPRTTHIRNQRAVAAGTFGFARGGVEVNDARRRQQRAHAVEQGGLARAGAAHEQEAALGDRHFGQARERPPVEHLQTAHAELVCAGVAGRVVEQRGSGEQGLGGRFHAAHPSTAAQGATVANRFGATRGRVIRRRRR